jgi:hypothetical protein
MKLIKKKYSILSFKFLELLIKYFFTFPLIIINQEYPNLYFLIKSYSI